MNKLFLSDEELRTVMLLERRVQELLEKARDEQDIDKSREIVEMADRLTDMKYTILNKGKQAKAVDMTAVITGVVGFISIKEVLAFERTGVITSKIFPSVSKWIGK